MSIIDFKVFFGSVIGLVLMVNSHAGGGGVDALAEELGWEKVGYTVNELLLSPEQHLGQEISISGLLIVGDVVSLSSGIDMIAGGAEYLPIDNRSRSKFLPFDGCLVAVTGKVKRVGIDGGTYILSDVTELSRVGALYLSAQGLMRERGIKGEPVCLGKALIELMATSINGVRVD